MKPYLQAWDILKPRSQAASSVDGKENLFPRRPWPPVDQSALTLPLTCHVLSKREKRDGEKGCGPSVRPDLGAPCSRAVAPSLELCSSCCLQASRSHCIPQCQQRKPLVVHLFQQQQHLERPVPPQPVCLRKLGGQTLRSLSHAPLRLCTWFGLGRHGIQDSNLS